MCVVERCFGVFGLVWFLLVFIGLAWPGHVCIATTFASCSLQLIHLGVACKPGRAGFEDGVVYEGVLDVEGAGRVLGVPVSEGSHRYGDGKR
jgi:hypothetical protein